jgi:hydroxyacylglutathione hydrolase
MRLRSGGNLSRVETSFQVRGKKKGGERLPRPPFFRHMEKVNLQGGIEPILRPGGVRLVGVEEFDAACAGKLVYDTREPEAFASAYIHGSYSIWLGGLPVFGGWVGDAESPVFLVTDRDDDVDTATLHLSRIGIDNVQAALAGGFGSWRNSGNPMARAGSITPRELYAALEQFQVLDVREPDEYDAGHIPSARALYVGYLPERLHELDLSRDKPVAITCAVGHRAGLGVSLLLREGFHDVRNLLGGMSAWQALELPVET